MKEYAKIQESIEIRGGHLWERILHESPVLLHVLQTELFQTVFLRMFEALEDTVSLSLWSKEKMCLLSSIRR